MRVLHILAATDGHSWESHSVPFALRQTASPTDPIRIYISLMADTGNPRERRVAMTWMRHQERLSQYLQRQDQGLPMSLPVPPLVSFMMYRPVVGSGGDRPDSVKRFL
jgi:hypothetical protein